MKNYKNWKLVERFANTEDYKGNTIISLEETDLLIKNLKDFSVDDKVYLYRGIDLPEPFYIIDPKKDRREYVVGTMPTLIMEYQESWKEFPSRMSSLFITNGGEESPTTYGKCYRVIPFDDAKFGVSSNNNYKTSFKNLKKIGYDANNFFYELAELYYYISGSIFTIPETKEEKSNYVTKENYELLMMQIDELLLMNKSDNKILNDFNNADALIDYYFNAKNNGFEIMNYKEIQEILEPREIWTDSKCLLIDNDIYNKIYKI